MAKILKDTFLQHVTHNYVVKLDKDFTCYLFIILDLSWFQYDRISGFGGFLSVFFFQNHMMCDKVLEKLCLFRTAGCWICAITIYHKKIRSLL